MASLQQSIEQFLAEAPRETLETGKTLGFVENGETYQVSVSALRKMQTMRLGALPVDAIAVPEKLLPLSEPDQSNAVLNIGNRLTQFFPGYFVAGLYELQSIFKRAGLNAYLIGGIVRDILLCEDRMQEVVDVDITVEGDALDTSELIVSQSRNFTIFERFPAFGTAKIQYKEGLILDIASTRKERYLACAALPEVIERGVPLAVDVKRRDFTINSLALSIHELGRLHDPNRGVSDLLERTIRVLHSASFFEDPSRVLRALKFAARLDFNLSPETRYGIQQFLRYANRVYKGGGDRVKEELKDLFSVKEGLAKQKWLHQFEHLYALRLVNTQLQQVDPEMAAENTQLENISLRVQYMEQEFHRLRLSYHLADLYIAFMLLPLEGSLFTETVHRLGLTRHEREAIEFLRRPERMRKIQELTQRSSSVDVYKAFHHLPQQTVLACILQASLSDSEHAKVLLEAFARYKQKWENMHLELDGHDLIQLGVPEGEKIGMILRELLYIKLSGGIPSRFDEIQFVQDWLGNTQQGSHEPVERPVWQHDMPEDDAYFEDEESMA